MNLLLAYTKTVENAQHNTTNGMLWNKTPATANVIDEMINSFPKGWMSKSDHFDELEVYPAPKSPFGTGTSDRMVSVKLLAVRPSSSASGDSISL
jgi:hypothetical protein